MTLTHNVPLFDRLLSCSVQPMIKMKVVTELVAVFLGLTALSVQTHGETGFLAIIMGPGPYRLSPNITVQEATPLPDRILDKLSTNEIVPLNPNPPPVDDTAKMARFIVHYSLWGSLSHISRQPDILGSPLARVYSISDGPITASSGIPYMYLTPNDPELVDMFKDPRASLTLTLAQTPYCRAKAYDPEDPRCAQVILTGKLVVLKNTTAEWTQAQQALFSRHPVMRTWPDSHHWLCCKLDIKRILVVDNFGGNKFPTVADYYKARPDVCDHNNSLLDMLFY